jgi:hypothetical protein
MVGYTAAGASDAQWFANSPAEVWRAVRHYLAQKKIRSCDDRTMRLEVNLGMTGWTGNCVATISVQPAVQGGSTLHFNGRMGAFSQQQIGAQRRIEDERTRLIHAVASVLPIPNPQAAPTQQTREPGLADELRKLAELNASGVLTDEEFAAAKARLIPRS